MLKEMMQVHLSEFLSEMSLVLWLVLLMEMIWVHLCDFLSVVWWVYLIELRQESGSGHAAALSGWRC